MPLKHYLGVQADIQLLVKAGYRHSYAKLIAEHAKGRQNVPELSILKLASFNSNVIIYNNKIKSKYGAIRVRKTRGKNSCNFYFQVNDIKNEDESKSTKSTRSNSPKNGEHQNTGQQSIW